MRRLGVRGLRRALAAIAAGPLLAACSSFGGEMPPPKHWVEAPAGSGTWVETFERPNWAVSPPRREGHLRFVAEARSHLRSLAAGEGSPSAAAAAATSVFERLEPRIGETDALSAGAAAVDGLRLVARACREQPLTEDADPENTLWTAWALWEVPIESVVAPLPPERRDAAAAALAR